jgi:preprotein translocase SecE subunit
MEIYKRGQGSWARGFAIALFILFGGWGVWVVYSIPREMNILLKPGDVLWPDTVRRLVRSGKASVRVRGLANQRVGKDVQRPGLRPARRIETPEGHAIVLETEDLNDPERLKAMEGAKPPIRFIPVVDSNAANALQDSVEIDEWLVGRRLAEDVAEPDVKIFEGTAPGVKVDAAILARIRKELEPFPEARVGPLWKTADAQEKKEAPASLAAAEVAEGMICADKIVVPVVRRVAEKDSTITREVFDAMKALEGKGRLKRIKIADEGTLDLDPARADDLGSRYLVAEDSKAVETFWNRTLLEFLGMRATPGLLIGLGLMLGVVAVSLGSWNFQKWNDLLIDTQTEMRKVSWPKRSELIGSSMIVILTVVVMGLFLYVVDFLLTAAAMKVGLLR